MEEIEGERDREKRVWVATFFRVDSVLGVRESREREMEERENIGCEKPKTSI